MSEKLSQTPFLRDPAIQGSVEMLVKDMCGQACTWTCAHVCCIPVYILLTHGKDYSDHLKAFTRNFFCSKNSRSDAKGTDFEDQSKVT